MIAQVHTISHGAAMTTYAMDKLDAETVKLNFLPEDLSPSAIWGRMMLHIRETERQRKGNNEFKKFAIRIELSPSKEETEGWTMADWQQLVDEFINEFDSLDMTPYHGRPKDAHTNLAHSQYVASLHVDSESGIPHLHIVVNRVDMDGHVNNDHKIRERGWMAADIINQRRRWKLPKDIRDRHRHQINDACKAALRELDKFTWEGYCDKMKSKGYSVMLRHDKQGKLVGYTVWMGNSHFKASELGVARNLTVPKIEHTWQKLHQHDGQHIVAPSGTGLKPDSQLSRPASATPDATKPKSVVERYMERKAEQQRTAEPPRYIKDIPYKDENCHIDIPQAIHDLIDREVSVHPDNETATHEDVVKVAMLLFAGYIDAATAMSESSGGGGSAPDSGWGRDKDDDEEWARRCAQMATRMSTPKPKYGYKRGR